MFRNSVFASLVLPAILISVGVVGCTKEAAVPKATQDDNSTAQAGAKDAEIKVNLAKLSEEDRREAEAQKFCVIEREHRLGEMGVPIKLMIEGQPVFLCCEDCKDDALKDPKTTLAKVAELKQTNSSAK